LNSVFAQYEELPSPQFAVINLSLRLRLITANFGLDNSSYRAQPHSIIVNYISVLCVKCVIQYVLYVMCIRNFFIEIKFDKYDAKFLLYSLYFLLELNNLLYFYFFKEIMFDKYDVKHKSCSLLYCFFIAANSTFLKENQVWQTWCQIFRHAVYAVFLLLLS
jgi:hypothetical protein